MNDSLYIGPWKQGNFRAVNKFYRRQKHKGSANGDEHVFVIEDTSAEKEKQLLAAVRLVPAQDQDYFWLRSLYVDQAHRQQGLGIQLLANINQHIPLPIYCFPYDHLAHFYGQAGYQGISPEQLPVSLQQLFQRYLGKGEKIIAMARGLNNQTQPPT